MAPTLAKMRCPPPLLWGMVPIFRRCPELRYQVNQIDAHCFDRRSNGWASTVLLPRFLKPETAGKGVHIPGFAI
jgi:hypothetical protein